MTDELAARIATALENIAFELSENGAVGEQLYLLRDILDNVVHEDQYGKHFLRILDIGRD